MENEVKITIESIADIVSAREQGRVIGQAIGFSLIDLTVIATAISEVARNIIEFAKRGEIVLGTVKQSGRCGISIIAKDNGPGIPDISLAMQDGYSTRKGLGLGLPGARRLMDDFEIISKVGCGTTITMKKWLN